jgi:hypothetical protein
MFIIFHTMKVMAPGLANVVESTLSKARHFTTGF